MSSSPHAPSLPVLLGRSNYTAWHSAIHPILSTHPTASTLLSGSWPPPITNLSPTTATSSIQQERAVALADYDLANLSVCRFIRGTLAMNVLPFVRGFTEAKALWEMLVGLYGEANGIAMVGGLGPGGMKFAETGVGQQKAVVGERKKEGSTSQDSGGGKAEARESGDGKGKERMGAEIIVTQVKPEGHGYDMNYTKEGKDSNVESIECEEQGLLVDQSRPVTPTV